MKIEKKIADMRFYGDKRNTDDIVYIVVQSIGNKPTPHYHIVEGEAVQIVPDHNISNSVNGARVNKRGYLHGVCTKYNSISIGVPEKMSDKDKQTCFNLLMTLKQRYKVKNENIVRQINVTGENDPAEWHDEEKWKRDIKNKLIDL